jgi:di/tricarboxylate transporter
MTPSIAFMLLLMGGALVAFVKELFPIEVTALGLLAILLVTGTIEPRDAVAGFSSTAVVAIASLFVLSHALTKTGALETVADWVGDRAQARPELAMLFLLLAVGFGSGVLNNTAVVALSIPLVMKLCRRLDLSPSKVLLPISYASILGGTLTLIGTSTNLLVSSLMEDAGEPPLAMFEFSILGAVIMAAGMLYIIAAARSLLPARAASGALTDRYLGDGFLTELVVTDGSALAGHNLSEEHVNERYRVTVLEVVRGPSETHLEDVATVPLQGGDHLVVQGALEDILRLRRDHGLELLPDAKLGDRQLASGGQVLAEAWIAPGSQMIGRTLKQLDFHRHHGAFVMAVRRVGTTLRVRLGDVALRLADALLILAPRDRLDELERSGDLKILSEHHVHLRREPFWWLVLIVLPLVVAAAALGWIDIAGGALIGAVTLLLFRVMTPEEAYRSMNWPVLFMIAAFVPLGHAFQVTGTADFLARGVLLASDWAPAELAPHLVLAVVYLLASALTQVASNSAAAIVVVPIALSLGPSLGVDSRPFVIGVCFAASAAFVTPMSYQTNLMVYAPGEYRFVDFVRFGTPLSLLSWLLSVLLIPLFWPF